jgi:ubiquinone/menaquinone biosynthesis C-methylase UbiE
MGADGEHRVFDEIWKRTNLFYHAGAVRECRSFPELWETVKFQRLEEFFPHTPQRSLEVGCGSGGVSLYFHDQYGYDVTLVDLSDEALAFARRNLAANSTAPRQNATFLKADAKRLPLENDSFDLVMSFGLLEHFADIEQPVAEQMRVLRPGGLFFADIVTGRFSVDSFSRFPARVKRALANLVRGQWHDLVALGRPDLYENTLPLSAYVKNVERRGGQVRFARGNRPVTSLNFPLFGSLFLRLYKTALVQRGWRRFDLSGSRFSRLWGAGWWILAIKQP